LSEKRIVVPGELLTENRKKLGDHVFIENGKVFSDSLGLLQEDESSVRVIPLQGRYMPRTGDLIVGIVKSIQFAGYIIDINSFYFSFLRKTELRKPLEKGMVISAKISDVDEVNEAHLENVRVFYGGEVVDVSPVKVPRIIGKKGSMLQVLKDGTGSAVMAGRNGRVWVKDGDTYLIKKAIRKIENEAHMSNLTVRMQAFIEDEKRKASIEMEE